VARLGLLATWAAMPLALTAAFAADEAVLLAATWILPCASGVFALPVVLRIFAINAAAASVLLGVHGLASVAGWPTVRRRPAAGAEAACQTRSHKHILMCRWSRASG
jgi:hypothetical protein